MPRSVVLRFALLVVLLAGLAGWAVSARVDPRHLLDAVRHSPAPAPLLGIAGCAVLVCALVPRTVLALAAGMLFGGGPGTGYALVGVTAGSAAAFGIGRLLGHSFVQARLRGRAAAAERAVTARGIWAVAAARMLPIAHFGVCNYVFGTTSLRLRRYLAGTVLGVAPGIATYAVLGAAAARGDTGTAAVAGAVAVLLSAIGLAGSVQLCRRRPAAAGKQSSPPRTDPGSRGGHPAAGSRPATGSLRPPVSGAGRRG